MWSAHGFSATRTPQPRTTATAAHRNSFVKHPLIRRMLASIFPALTSEAHSARLFVAQRDHRIDARRTPRGDVNRERGDDDE
jgi:hypothetical protein